MKHSAPLAASGLLALRMTSETVSNWMVVFEERIKGSEPLLTELDRAIGDGDHGANMRRGMKAVVEGLRKSSPPDISGRLRAISELLTSSVGGASGPLYGAFFLHGSRAIPNKAELGLNELVTFVEAGCQGVVQLGKASIGDKTMVDTLASAAGALRSAAGRRESLPVALSSGIQATSRAARGTTPMLARRGRASYLGERSIGFQDPGATSAHLLFEALAEAVVPLSPLNSLNPQRSSQPATL